MATYTIEFPVGSVDSVEPAYASSVGAETAVPGPVGDIVEAARSASTDAVARVRAAYDHNPARTFLLVVVSLAGLVAIITSLSRHG
ncbi:hypothetical protein [Microbacterium sp.]|uniref:hypothetical protein n=1 Tax=Microbacterium sp. TaxID=51671 RepID=UPI002E323C96|nr:hypothetical protein [Microbacterium sp.]HEX5729433.1 hypothetical protein [Microbacterium sp.]